MSEEEIREIVLGVLSRAEDRATAIDQLRFALTEKEYNGDTFYVTKVRFADGLRIADIWVFPANNERVKKVSTTFEPVS